MNFAEILANILTFLIGSVAGIMALVVVVVCILAVNYILLWAVGLFAGEAEHEYYYWFWFGSAFCAIILAAADAVIVAGIANAFGATGNLPYAIGAFIALVLSGIVFSYHTFTGK